MLERHFPTSDLIQQNAVQLGIEKQVEVIASDTFFWVRRQWIPTTQPVVVFCSPPYDFYVQRLDETLEMISALATRCSVGSTLVIEADARFNVDQLPRSLSWDVRVYAPAVIAIGDVTAS
jgi:16S rRNA G966 N2-methylase RsmD